MLNQYRQRHQTAFAAVLISCLLTVFTINQIITPYTAITTRIARQNNKIGNISSDICEKISVLPVIEYCNKGMQIIKNRINGNIHKINDNTFFIDTPPLSKTKESSHIVMSLPS